MDSFVLPQHDGVSSTFASSPSSLFSRKFPLFSDLSASCILPSSREASWCSKVRLLESSKEVDRRMPRTQMHLEFREEMKIFRRIWITDSCELRCFGLS